MSTLFLVRHAQASFLESDYDRLSTLGHDQARLLGEHWAERGIELDAIYSGPRKRQRHTAELVQGALAKAGRSAPEIVVLEELDEYRAEEIFQAHATELFRMHRELADWFAEFQSGTDRRSRGRAFDRMLQYALRLWATDAFDASAIESFAAFRERLDRALERVTAGEGTGRRIAAFSSGGAIGAMVARLLGTNPEVALELGWNVNNAGVTEILFSGERRSLRRFNVLGHLPDEATWTHR